MKSLLLAVLLVGTTALAGENFKASFGSVTVNKSPDSVSPMFIYGDAAKAMYDAMTDVKAQGHEKVGQHVTCKIEKNIGGGNGDGYRCDLQLTSSGAFVE